MTNHMKEVAKLLGVELRETFNVVANRPWKPTFREIYYVPSILNRDLYDFNSWNNDEYDKELYRRRVVFKTKEEAIRAAEKMLAVAKEVEANG